jgi:3-keto-disaccharide hydrolase
MKKLLIVIAIAVAALIPALSQRSANPFAGRWDVTLTVDGHQFPSWLEVTESAGTLKARVQQRTGNVRPAPEARMDGSRLLVTVANAAPARAASGRRPATPARPALTWELTESSGKISGTQRRGDTTGQLTGVRAPALKRDPPAAWSDPEPLFNGRDLTGWEPVNNTPEAINEKFTSHWRARNGELVNEGRGSNIRTTRTFDDFKLHVEWICPPGENSGVYLRGRYEAQVTPPPVPGARRRGATSYPGGIGSIYGYLAPTAEPRYVPDWQSYDLTLIGRWVTVVFNGTTLIDNQEIAGPTGGALDANEGEPGPVYFQGDHHGGIRYRNITISQPKG